MNCNAVLRLACAALLFWCAGALPASSETRRIVVLYDERIDLPGLAGLNRRLLDVLKTNSTDNLEIYREELELSRFRSNTHAPLLHNYLRAKYADKKIDVVVAAMGPTLEFLLGQGEQIFPGIPVVFCGISGGELETLSLPPHVTGVLLARGLRPTLDLIVRVHPDTKQIVFVGGASQYSLRIAEMAKREFRDYEDRVAFRYLTGLPMRELLAELSRLPPYTVAMYAGVFEDGEGAPFDPYEVAEKVSAAANAPVYGMTDGLLGRGVVGGRMHTFAAQGGRAAELVLQILAGKKPSDLPIGESSDFEDMFDSRQLARWQISENRLPAGSEVLLRSPTLWQDYRDEATIAVLIGVFQTLLIVAIVWEDRRRRRAQVAMRASYQEAQDLARRLISAREAERARIALELHDDLSQKLALLAMEVDLLGRDASRADMVAQRVNSLAARARGIATDVHNLSHQLHPSTLETLGLASALQDLCHELSTQEGLQVDFRLGPVPKKIPSETALCLFRIAQEALNNVVKHSGATRAEVELNLAGDTLYLSVSDSGRGFTLGDIHARALGLVGMRERMHLIGGQLAIHSAPGAGTRISVQARVRFVHAEV